MKIALGEVLTNQHPGRVLIIHPGPTSSDPSWLIKVTEHWPDGTEAHFADNDDGDLRGLIEAICDVLERAKNTPAGEA